MKPTPPTRSLVVLLWTGTVARVLFFVCFLGLMVWMKNNPGADPTSLWGLMLGCVGLALGPGLGIPMLWTGQLRVRAGLLPALYGVQTGAAATASPSKGVQLLGGVLTVAGTAGVLLGAVLFWSGLGAVLGSG